MGSTLKSLLTQEMAELARSQTSPMFNEAKTPARRALRPLNAVEADQTSFIDVSLLRAADICSRLKISRSYWLAKVAAGEAPDPVIKAHRFTRWRAADVAAWVEAQTRREA